MPSLAVTGTTGRDVDPDAPGAHFFSGAPDACRWAPNIDGVIRARTIVFDLDGTLFDHVGSARAGLGEWLSATGVEPTRALEEAWFAAEARHFVSWRDGLVSWNEQRRLRLREFLPLVGRSSGADDELDTLFELLRAARGRKPVVILKGGRTADGQRASASHTAALAQDDRLWQAFARQTGAALVETLDGFIDALLLLQTLSARAAQPTRHVVLFGNGGGTSVLAADAFSRAGFRVPQFGPDALAPLRALGLPAGSSIQNPVDIPAGILRRDDGRIASQIFAAFLRERSIGAVVMHLNMTVILGYANPRIMPNLFAAALDARGSSRDAAHFILVLRSDGHPSIEEQKQRYREQALSQGIPVYNELGEAAQALRVLAGYEAFLAGHENGR